MTIQKYDLFFAELPPESGSVQCGSRPVVVVQCEAGNRANGPTTIIVPITSRRHKHRIPTHVHIPKGILPRDSIAICEQIRTVDRCILVKPLGRIEDPDIQTRLDKAMAIALDLV